jgi:hypothetical protein
MIIEKIATSRLEVGTRDDKRYPLCLPEKGSTFWIPAPSSAKATEGLVAGMTMDNE